MKDFTAIIAIILISIMFGIALSQAQELSAEQANPIALIAGPKTGTGTESDPYRPLVADEYVLLSWSDVTAQHPGYECVIEAMVTAEVLNAIAEDKRFEAVK